jgi:hypothetical protein
MQLSHEVNSRLTINGFTMNPITKPELLTVVLDGLVSYKDNHLCDYGQISVHKNYLGKKINNPTVIEVSDNENSFIHGHVNLSNGWIDIRIWNKIYPAEILMDVYIRGIMPDPDLIIDHLCAPAVPMDGMGMFNYTYNLQSNPIINSTMSKSKIDQSQYKVNSPAVINGPDVEVTLNQLSKIECHFCSAPGTDWIIVGPPLPSDAKKLIPPKIVTSCKDHINYGKVTEIRYDNNKIPDVDHMVLDGESIQYEMIDVLNEDGSLKYTINRIKEK